MGGKYKGKHVAGNIDRPEAISDDAGDEQEDDTRLDLGSGDGTTEAGDSQHAPEEIKDGYPS
ncbi:hypothetical protein G1H11_16595 [Phytoactinopolyspora alkaliphila]|uniref:Uncharacterized protein n=1 Tax=Phytoactinopolyspora alkaliphila TaxID=1783498 RepID=A0A6N9YPP8_9ACTN|nr:hypothetical protein [Phytoactinopolyspora alkaliphila]NED96927.1 hypothetical protein [Phytoactinopolyspora alkaliphila]